jgi:hypothetical protein
MNQHIIQGTPAAFAKSVNQLVKDRDVSLSMRGISFEGGRLAAIIDESERSPSSSGSIISVQATVSKTPQKLIDDLRAENPMWTLDAVFPVGAADDTKAKATSTLVIASCRQP